MSADVCGNESLFLTLKLGIHFKSLLVTDQRKYIVMKETSWETE